MAGQCSAMFGCSWTEVSVMGSQVFGQALMESCAKGTSVKMGQPHPLLYLLKGAIFFLPMLSNGRTLDSTLVMQV